VEVLEKLLAIVLSLAILGQAIVIRRLVGTWLIPACIFSLFWFAYTFVPLVALFVVPIEPLAIAYILLACTLFSLTALGPDWHAAMRVRQNAGARFRYDTPFLRHLFHATTALVLLCQLADLLIQGFSPMDVVLNPLGTAAEYTARRYAEDLEKNVFAQLGLLLAYPAATMGGLLYGARAQGQPGYRTLLLAVLPSLAMMLIQGAKGTVFLAVFMIWGGVLLTRIERGEFTLIDQAGIKRLLFYCLLAFPFLLVSFLSRMLDSLDGGAEIVQQLLRYFASYTSAHLYAFSDWFSYWTLGNSVMEYQQDEDAYGFYTFMALFKLAGSSKTVPMGVYDEYFVYADLLQTNIYTFFRGLIQDFSVGGALCLITCSGFLLHWSYWRLLVCGKPILSAAVFVFSVAYFYTSFIISLLIWNNVYAGLLLLALFLRLNEEWCRRFGSAASPAPGPALQAICSKP